MPADRKRHRRDDEEGDAALALVGASARRTSPSMSSPGAKTEFNNYNYNKYKYVAATNEHSSYNNYEAAADVAVSKEHNGYSYGAVADAAVSEERNGYSYEAAANQNNKYGVANDEDYIHSVAATAADASQHRQQGGNGRRVWVKKRSSEWWDKMSRPDLPDEQFRKAFRMSRATFDFLCDELAAAVAKEDTSLRAAVPVRQRVAVAVYRLATGDALRQVSKHFGLGISTCHKLVLDVCAAIKSVLMPKAIVWPSTEDAAVATAARFEAISGVPNIIGAMHTTHVPIVAPKVSVAAYFNRRHTERNQKTSYSVTLQGVVDADGVLTDVCIGWPGSMTDEQVLEKSTLFNRAVGGHLAGRWVAGGAGYPLTDWVLVPYAGKNLTWGQHAFNERISDVESVAKAAFSRMKARWGCLRKRSEMKLQDLPVVLGACCVLHNICEMRNEVVEEELLAMAEEVVVRDDGAIAENCVRSERAAMARDSIAHNLLHRGLGGMNFM